jgi:hypothetical protein
MSGESKSTSAALRWARVALPANWCWLLPRMLPRLVFSSIWSWIATPLRHGRSSSRSGGCSVHRSSSEAPELDRRQASGLVRADAYELRQMQAAAASYGS